MLFFLSTYRLYFLHVDLCVFFFCLFRWMSTNFRWPVLILSPLCKSISECKRIHLKCLFFFRIFRTVSRVVVKSENDSNSITKFHIRKIVTHSFSLIWHFRYDVSLFSTFSFSDLFIFFFFWQKFSWTISSLPHVILERSMLTFFRVCFCCSVFSCLISQMHAPKSNGFSFVTLAKFRFVSFLGQKCIKKNRTKIALASERENVCFFELEHSQLFLSINAKVTERTSGKRRFLFFLFIYRCVDACGSLFAIRLNMKIQFNFILLPTK